MIYIIISSVIILSIIASIKYTQKQNKKRILSGIRHRFGVIPNKKIDEKELRYLIDSEERECDIDDITWNDLDMDKVYARINACHSFVGAQVLYRNLHYLNQEPQNVQEMEQRIEALCENQKKRESIQLQLSKINKGMYSYYLPMFVKDIEDFQIWNIGIYRMLTGLLIGSLVTGFLFYTPLLLITAIVFAINMAVYILKKM